MKNLKIGWALGGGAARGLAHIGVLKVLEKYKIPIHIIAGTSMGAFIGGAYAGGMEASRMEEIAINTNKKLLARMFSLAVSFSGLIDGKKIEEFLKVVLEEKNIEELDKRFACVATDILTGEEVIIDKGPLVEAIMASISIPAIFTPVYYRNRFLVDGGIVNPVPVNVAKKMGADIIIAVNVIPPFPSEIKKEKEENNKEENKKSPPNIISILLNTINIFEEEIIKLRLEKDKPNFLIEPDISNIKPREFYKAKEAIEAGEKATERIIADIWEIIERRG
jgi:NTE family protein